MNGSQEASITGKEMPYSGVTGAAAKTSSSCTSNSVTTRPSNTPSSTDFHFSKQGLREATKSNVVFFLNKPTALTGSNILLFEKPFSTTWIRNVKHSKSAFRNMREARIEMEPDRRILLDDH